MFVSHVDLISIVYKNVFLFPFLIIIRKEGISFTCLKCSFKPYFTLNRRSDGNRIEKQTNIKIKGIAVFIYSLQNRMENLTHRKTSYENKSRCKNSHKEYNTVNREKDEFTTRAD